MENQDHVKSQCVFLNPLWELDLLLSHSAQTLPLHQADSK